MEMKSELVEEITRRILLALAQETIPHPHALLLGAQQLPQEWEGRWQVRQYQTEADFEGCEQVVVAALTASELADLAMGRDDGPVTGPVAQALLRGIPVLVLEQALKHRVFRTTANPQYFAMLEHYVECLSSFGVQIGGTQNQAMCAPLAEKPVELPAQSPPEALPETTETVIGLLTAEAARALAQRTKRVHLAPGAVLTPLARDVLREKGVTLQEEEKC